VELPAAFDPIVNAPTPHKIALGVMGLLILGAAAYFLLLSPLEARVATLETQHAAVEKELIQNRAIVADLARFRREMAEVEKRLEVLKVRLPNEKEIPPLYRTLSEAALKAGLDVALFQPREPKTRDYYTKVPITISAEGGYHQVGEFLERVASLPRVVIVDELKLTGLSKARRALRADVTLDTYVYRPVGAPPAPKPAGAK
jgi:type IV pilus assembly protein PilO